VCFGRRTQNRKVRKTSEGSGPVRSNRSVGAGPALDLNLFRSSRRRATVRLRDLRPAGFTLSQAPSGLEEGISARGNKSVGKRDGAASLQLRNRCPKPSSTPCSSAFVLAGRNDPRRSQRFGFARGCDGLAVLSPGWQLLAVCCSPHLIQLRFAALAARRRA
jgi:hypothetical protein